MSLAALPETRGMTRVSSSAAEHAARYLAQRLGLPVDADDEAVRELAPRLFGADEYGAPPGFHNRHLHRTAAQLEPLLAARGGAVTWPSGKKFGLCLTHDVDRLRVTAHVERWRTLWRARGASWRERATLLASTARHAARAAVRGVQYYPLDIWLRAEDEFGFRSTFYFMGAPLTIPDARDNYYRLDDSWLNEGRLRPVRELLPELAAGGWEVGMHGSIASAYNVDIARGERLRLSDAAGVEVVSGRQHYLHGDLPRTSLIHEAAGLRTDSTFGSNVEPVSYRFGTGLPFPMYHIGEDRPLSVTQVPLIIHDNALMVAAGGDVDRAVAIAVRELEVAAKYGGMVTMLFHPNYLESEACFQAYRGILAAAHDLGAWGCSALQAATVAGTLRVPSA